MGLSESEDPASRLDLRANAIDWQYTPEIDIDGEIAYKKRILLSLMDRIIFITATSSLVGLISKTEA